MSEEKKKNITKLATPILVILLLGASFLIGSLFTQLKTLQGGKQEEVPTAIAEATPIVRERAQAEPGEIVLGAEDLAKVEKGEIVKGSPNAPITIVEFSEYQCPFCAQYVEGAYVQLWAEYGNQIRYIFRDYPLPFHQHAQKASEAARCAGDQGDYWGYHDLLFAGQSQWSAQSTVDDVFEGYAKELGLNTSQFSDCLSQGKFTQAVKNDFALGQRVGVSGTPSFFINGRLLVGSQPFSAFQAVIEKELNK